MTEREWLNYVNSNSIVDLEANFSHWRKEKTNNNTQ